MGTSLKTPTIFSVLEEDETYTTYCRCPDCGVTSIVRGDPDDAPTVCATCTITRRDRNRQRVQEQKSIGIKGPSKGCLPSYMGLYVGTTPVNVIHRETSAMRQEVPSRTTLHTIQVPGRLGIVAATEQTRQVVGRMNVAEELVQSTKEIKQPRETSSRAAKTSGYRGVSYDSKTQRWTAKITVNDKLIIIGGYATEFEAAKAWNLASIHYHGKFAILNNVWGIVDENI